MRPVEIETEGSFGSTERFLQGLRGNKIRNSLDPHAQSGVVALRGATPSDTGKTAASWDYEIRVIREGYDIYWTNSNVVRGMPIAALIQYGHATGTGGWVPGRDYINPVMSPVFDRATDNVWRAVIR